MSLESYEAFFDESFDDPQQFFENGGIDSLYENENSRDTECNVQSVDVLKVCP